MRSYMDLELTIEQSQLKKTVRAFLKKEIAPIVNEYESHHDSYTKSMVIEIFNKLIPFGYINGLVPESEGGTGIDFLSYGLLLEELARISPSLSFFFFQAEDGIRDSMYKHGSKDLKDRYLSRLLSL